MSVSEDNNECRGEIKYKLLAQIVPIDDENWADKKKKISKLRSERLIIIMKPQFQIPEPMSYTFNLQNKIGGMMGFGGSGECTSEVIFDRNNYKVGETVKVLIKCDNTKCKTNVKSFKLKLKRRLFVTCWSNWDVKKDINSELQETHHASDYIVEVKGEGCKKGEKVERVIEFQIPEFDVFPKNNLDIKSRKELINPFSMKILREFTPSVYSKHLKVEYILKCFIKHDSFSEIGEGNPVYMPIMIFQPLVAIMAPIPFPMT